MMRFELFGGRDRLFAVVATGGSDKLPERYGPWTHFKTPELTRGSSLPGLNVEECLDDMERHGIHVTDAHVRITEQAIA
jgi:hypothetical protein